MTFSNDSGDLIVAEEGTDVPFEIKRMFYIKHVPFEMIRGDHAHKKFKQFLIAISGSFSVSLDDGIEVKTDRLCDPNVGLYVGPKMWVKLSRFTSDAICMVLTSDYYDEKDYIRDYQEFLKIVKEDV